MPIRKSDLREDGGKITTMSTAHAERLDASRVRSWLNPLNMMPLQKAVAAEQDSVELQLIRGKVRFKIDYLENDRICLNPTDGQFVPCGTFEIRWVKDYFLTHGQ